MMGQVLPARSFLSKWRLACSGLLIAGSICLPSIGELDYRDHESLTAQLRQLADGHRDLVRLTRSATTVGGRSLWLVEVGAGSDTDRKERPALLLVAGIEGGHVDSVIAIRWIQHLLASGQTNQTVRAMLDRTTIYIFPQANPDAAESLFARPRLERDTNLTPVDEDKDGLVDEDPPEDLNGDGLITSMRVEDPEGQYIADPTESRLLIKAEKAKGEKGVWKVFPEGSDTDKDESWNEDGTGGVNLNRNFPYSYTFFGESSGPHQVSENETRALADFVVAHPNIAVVFTFGTTDNLVQTPKSEPGGKRPPAAISDADAAFYKELGRLYREALGLPKELKGTTEPGSFPDWIYFHRGRLSLAAKPWTPDAQIARDKSAESKPEKSAEAGGKSSKEKATPAPESKNEAGDSESGSPPDKEKKPEGDDRGKDERVALKWFDAHAPDRFIPWTRIDHPDFPGRKVEVGGWAPFAKTDPPVNLLNDLTDRHVRFLTELANKLPRIAFRKAEAKHLGNGVYELTLQIENTGYLPTALAQGALTREVQRTRVRLDVDKNRILAGRQTTLLGPIAGSGGMEELRYIIRATGSVEVEVVSALGGSVRRTIHLRDQE